jgi:hypothetical protein
MGKLKSIIVVLFIISFCLPSTAQDSSNTQKRKPFEIGLSLGSPELISLHGVYFLPGLNNHVTIGARAGWYKINEIKSILWGVNIDYYIKHSGKGLYFGAEFERNSIKLSNPTNNTVIDDFTFATTFDYTYYYRYYSFYAGYACIWDKFYVTPELGICCSHTDNYVIETVLIKNITKTVTEPLNPQLKANEVGLLLRLSVGYRF